MSYQTFVEAREALLGRGVDVGEVRDMGGILFAGFADPDGNQKES